MKSLPGNVGLVLLFILFISGSASPVITPEPSPEPTQTATTTLPIPTATLGEPIFVSALCTLYGKPVETHIATGSPVYLHWNWMATTSDYVQLFIDKTNLVVTFNGQVLSNPTMGAIEPVPNSENSLVKWKQDLGVLSPGIYFITYDASWNEQITDGIDTYGPGGEYLTLHDACTLIVDP